MQILRLTHLSRTVSRSQVSQRKIVALRIWLWYFIGSGICSSELRILQFALNDESRSPSKVRKQEADSKRSIMEVGSAVRPRRVNVKIALAVSSASPAIWGAAKVSVLQIAMMGILLFTKAHDPTSRAQLRFHEISNPDKSFSLQVLC